VKRNPFLMLTWSSLKAYFRNRGAIFFSLLVPLMIMGIFGLINFGNSTPSVNIGVVDQAHNQVSNRIIDNLRSIKAVKLHLGSLDAEKRELTQGNRDLVAVLPASIGQGSTAIAGYYNQGSPQNSQVAIAIMNQFMDQASFAQAGVAPAFTLQAQPVQSRNLTYVDFLVPGMIALSIMQTGLFGVVFTFVQWKQRGILRRLMATPMRVRDFFFSQLVTRLTPIDEPPRAGLTNTGSPRLSRCAGSSVDCDARSTACAPIGSPSATSNFLVNSLSIPAALANTPAPT